VPTADGIQGQFGPIQPSTKFALWVWDMAYKAVKNEIIKYINNNDL
jgi:hypothetical protein